MSAIDPKSIGIAVITSYPKWYQGSLRSIKHTHKIRGDLALEFLNSVSHCGYQAVCVDGSSTKTFKRQLASIPGIHVISKKTITAAPAKRLAIKALAKLQDVQVIVMSEPEKISFLHSLDKVVLPILDNSYDIIVPKRKNVLFKSSYPDYMYASETEGNKLFNEALAAHGLLTKDVSDMDSFFGPRAFANNPKVVQLFTKVYMPNSKAKNVNYFMSPEAYTNIQYLPLVQALYEGIRVKSIEVPFTYPLIQKENEQLGAVNTFIEKRTMQRMGILIHLMQFLGKLKK